MPMSNQTASRLQRINQRRLLVGIDDFDSGGLGHLNSEVIKYHQHKIQKRSLKFGKSKIHNWGLFTLEPIQQGDLILEYVGEVISQKVADQREKEYYKNGIGSSYLFRVIWYLMYR